LLDSLLQETEKFSHLAVLLGLALQEAFSPSSGWKV